MNLNGSGQTNIANGAIPFEDFFPAISPDGKRIVLTTRTTGIPPMDLYAINPNGTGAVNLTNTPAFDETNPDYSPDGRRIVYEGARAEHACDIYASEPDGTGAVNLTNHARLDVRVRSGVFTGRAAIVYQRIRSRRTAHGRSLGDERRRHGPEATDEFVRSRGVTDLRRPTGNASPSQARR